MVDGDVLRSDYKMTLQVLKTFSSISTPPSKDEVRRVSDTFRRAGGSWVRLFRGSIRDVVLFKKVVKVAVKSGVFKGGKEE